MMPRIGMFFSTLAIVATAFLIDTPARGEPGAQRPAGVLKTTYARPDGTPLPAGNRAYLEPPLVLSAPPRETAEDGKSIYQPVAEYLSTVIGRRVVYQHPGSWGLYRTTMLRGGYDLVFDGPHFNSYRIEKLNHNVLVRIPAIHEFVVIARQGSEFRHMSDLAGRRICTHAPPNLGTLVLLSHFENPARQPVIRDTTGWNEIFTGVTSGRCDAGVMPLTNLKQFDPSNRMTVLFKSKPMLNQALSAGPRLSSVEQNKISAALLSPEAAGPTARLRAEYKVGPSFAAATNRQYEGLSNYLRNEWGYY
ncbi:MAG: PhnD/SsuA/transferrin family substrate-binding protein [Pseudomonadota bacterium]